MRSTSSLPQHDKPDGIRPFVTGDANDLSSIISRCLREVNSNEYPPEIIERMCAHYTPETITRLAGAREMFVDVRSSRAAGTVSRDRNLVYTMFVDPDCAGRGIGTELMDHVEQLAAVEGYTFMETGASITAHDFYRHRGYVDVRADDSEFGLNYVLRKVLSQT